MDLRYVLTTIYSPIKTFERIKSEKPSLLDSLLMFGFVYLLLLGVTYVVLSFLEPYYGFREILPVFVGLPSMLFLREPNFSNFLMSIGFGIVDILLFTGIVHLITGKAERKGSFSTLLMMFSLTQIVSVISVLAFLSLGRFSMVGSPIFIVPLFSTLIGVYIWKLALYFIGIKVNYKTRTETTFLLLVASFIIYSVISVWIFSFAYKTNVMEVFTQTTRVKPMAIEIIN